MALNGKKVKGGGKRAPALPAGTYPARIVQLINCGLQPQRPFKGKKKDPAIELRVTYELLDEFMVDEDGNEDESRPRWVFESFPVFNLRADKAKSTKRYTALDPDGDLDGDFLALIGMPCDVTLTCDDDKVYNNVSNVSAMRPKDAEKAPDLVNEPVVFDITEPDADVYVTLPDFIKDKLNECLELKGTDFEAMLDNLPDEPEEDDEEEEEKPKAKAKKKKDPEPDPEPEEEEDDDEEDEDW